MTGSASTQKRTYHKQTRYLSQAIQLEEAVNPHIIRATMSVISLAIFVFIIWASATSISEVARTSGEVVPHGHQQTLQHLEGGMVEAIHVTEGSLVQKGQLLLTLSDSGIKEDLQRLQSKHISLRLQAERLRAFLDNREPDFSSFPDTPRDVLSDHRAFYEGMVQARQKEENILKEQLSEKKLNITTFQQELASAQDSAKITEELYRRRAILNNKGLLPEIKLLESKRELNDLKGRVEQIQNKLAAAQNSVKEYTGRLDSLSAQHRDEALEQLSLVTAEKAQNTELLDKIAERIQRLKLTAPSTGIIKGLAINTIGAVVKPGETLMEIIPLDQLLEVQVKIQPQDIGHVAIGQPVHVKFSSYDFSRYGSVEGTLQHISATTFSGEGGERYYQGNIKLAQNFVGTPDRQVMPGMTVMADIITGHKTILQYLLKPIHISLKTAFTER